MMVDAPLARFAARTLAALTGIVALVLSVGLAPAHAGTSTVQTGSGSVGVVATAAADLSGFDPGYIISDAVFFNASAMTEAEIQSFLQSKVKSCQSGYTCLKDWYDTSRTTTADAMCGAYSGGVRERASRIIYKVAQACGINPQVILATLQKEQSLVTLTAPTEWRYTIAMGQGCPDTAACDTRYYGFFNQVFGAAWQFKRYANPPGTSQYFTWYAPGKTWNILYHPNRDCGSSPVTVRNQATSNLYYYTPYQPNGAALRAGYGTGDGCSSYGNRNFYNYFTDWFGSTRTSEFSAAPAPGINGTALAGQRLNAVVGSWSPAPSGFSYQWLRNGAPVPGATTAGYSVTNADAGASLSVRVVASRTGYLTTERVSGGVGAAGFPVDRLAGADRYDTAVAVSQRQNPSTVETVYLVTGADHADALTAAPRAAAERAAMLLSQTHALPAAVAEELRRLAPKKVVLIGGHGVLDAGTEDRVRAALSAVSPAATITRVAGVDRYETSRQLAVTGSPRPTVYLATGHTFPDALGAAAVAGRDSAPVLLVDGEAATLDAATVQTLTAVQARRIVIVGGEGAVSAGIAGDLVARGLEVVRYGGADRFATNSALNSASYPTATRAYVAVADDFPDALAGSVLAATASAPMLVSPSTCMGWQSADFLRSAKPANVTLVGGPGVLGSDVEALRRC